MRMGSLATVRAWRIAAGLLLVAGSGTAGPTASAQQTDSDAAREHFQKGQAAYRRGDYQEAIAQWEAAYQADPRPLILYNVSQAYERLGKLPEAVDALERYLREASADDPNQSDARARLAALRERLARTGVRIEGAPEGAAIYVDGKLWGRAPRPDPIPLDPGSHQVRVQLDGHETFRATIVVPAGERIAVEVDMPPLATTSPPQDTASDPPEEGSPGGPEGSPPAPAASRSGSSLLPIVLMAGGGALAVAGGVVGYLALDKAAGAENADDFDEAAGQARTLALLSDLALWPGLALAATGAVLLVLQGGDEAEHPEAASLRATPLLAPGLLGASLQGRFQ